MALQQPVSFAPPFGSTWRQRLQPATGRGSTRRWPTPATATCSWCTPGTGSGRTVRDTLNLIHELAEPGVGVRYLADPIKVDSTSPADPMAQLAVVLLALFGQMEAPTPWSEPRTPPPSRPLKAGGPAGPSWST